MTFPVRTSLAGLISGYRSSATTPPERENKKSIPTLPQKKRFSRDLLLLPVCLEHCVSIATALSPHAGGHRRVPALTRSLEVSVSDDHGHSPEREVFCIPQ